MYRAECGKKKELGCTQSNDHIDKESLIKIVDDEGKDYNLDPENNDITDKEILDMFHSWS